MKTRRPQIVISEEKYRACLKERNAANAANAELIALLSEARKEIAMLRADRDQAIERGVKEATKQIHDEAREFYRVEKRGAEKERDRSEKALGEALERMDRLERNHAKIRERNNELKAMLEELER